MSIFKILLLTAAVFLITSGHAANFNIQNRCSYTVWAAALPVGGGKRLDSRQSWSLNVSAGTTGGRIWARIGCEFQESDSGWCNTGDCGPLECQSSGWPPNTLAEFALNQYNNLDYFDISLVNGFNVPMAFNPTSNGCTRGISCTANIVGECPDALKTADGCNSPCFVFKTDEYCCNSGSCNATDYSRFFKTRCPDAYSYPKDDATSTFTCPGGTNYEVIFCPDCSKNNRCGTTYVNQCTIAIL